MEFGSVLRKMRNQAGYSQEELAEEMHIARSSISKLERNQLELRASDFARWASVTGAYDVMLAALCSLDIAVVQQILDSATTLVGLRNLGGLI